MLDDLKEKKAYWNLKEEALDCTLWRWPLREFDHSPLSSDEVENDWSLINTDDMQALRSVVNILMTCWVSQVYCEHTGDVQGLSGLL
jgi:hypothetical protein